jgi:hypothetical protein
VRGALAAAALVALLAAASASPAPARTAKLTKAENHWAVPVVNLMKSLSGRIGAVGNQVSDKTLLTKGSRAQLKLAVTLANLIACAGKLKQDGPPPTARLKPFATSMSSACSHYVAGSHLLAKGVGKATAGHSAADVKLGTSLITKAVGELRRGSTSLGRAQAQLVALTR